MRVTPQAEQRIRKALERLRADATIPERNTYLQTLTLAHRQALRALDAPLARSTAVLGEEDMALSLVMSAWEESRLEANAPREAEAGVSAAALLATHFLISRENIPDIDPFEGFDPGWADSLLKRLTSKKVPFPTPVAGEFPIYAMPDKARFALAGDWGTGSPAALHIGTLMQAQEPEYTIHLGDVYYSGTEKEERERFVTPWTPGNRGSFALNSNHEMYSGGAGYFNVALKSSKFGLQQGLSFFALENKHWMMVGLDSAYYAHSYLYQRGFVGGLDQIKLLETVDARAKAGNKRLIVLTHHDPMDSTGATNPLWREVTYRLTCGVDYWYWGHVHTPLVFRPRPLGGKSIRARCVGHGAVPYAPEPELVTPSGVVEWTETVTGHDMDEPRRGLNGFAVIELDGPTIVERFIDERGTVRWSS